MPDDATKVAVRPRTAHDLEACVALAEEVQRKDGYPSFLGDGTLAAFVTPDDAFGAWVADLGGDVVGNVALRPRSAPTSSALAADALGVDASRLGWVARLMVAPRARRRGVASLLLDTAVAEARRRELVPVLDVVSDDEGAVALYERTGWRHLGHETVTLRDGRVLPIDVFAAP